MRTKVHTLLFWFSLVMLVPPVCGAAETSYSLDISRQSITLALKEFSRQTGLAVGYMPADKAEEALQVGPLKGKYTAQSALKALLAPTAYRAEFINPRTIAIRPEREDRNASSALAPADLMRMAALDAERSAAAATNAERDAGNQVVVQGEREGRKPFADGNRDVPRTINDAQPYYIFDAKTVEQSGATNIQDFLKQRLSMNTVRLTNGQQSNIVNGRGDTSSIDLRGLGEDKTLVLVNGRRMAGVSVDGDDYQPDLNGIPLSAIDRIEVLPSSASGIYGGSAIGGVVNVILKREYAGGEMRLNYDDSWNGDSAARNVSASYGFSLEQGKTQVNVSATWADSRALRVGDRIDIIRQTMDELESHQPGYATFSSSQPWFGSLPNIMPSSASVTTLTIKPEYGGGTLNSRNTFVPAGTTPETTTAELAELLRANAGQWNLDFPLTLQQPSGLLRAFGSAPETRSFRLGVRRQTLPWLELTADLSWNENRSEQPMGPPVVSGALTVAATAPTNPFTTDIRITVPHAAELPNSSRSEAHSVSVGALAQLPWGWTGSLDYTWSESEYVRHYYAGASATTDLRNGTLNPFVDTLLHPIDLRRYIGERQSVGMTRLHDIALRGAGPLPALPWGQPRLVAGLEHRISQRPDGNYMRSDFPDYTVSPTSSMLTEYFPRDSVTNAAYAESTIPLVKPGRFTGLDSLELQLSGRVEHYRVDTGSASITTFYRSTPATVIVAQPRTADGEPVFSRTTYDSRNYTVGLKYQPVETLTFRMSRATAFIPPAPSQLITNPERNSFRPSVIDPTLSVSGPLPAGCSASGNGVSCPVWILSGGNPDLVPQNSRSLNAGLIWQPTAPALSGLRLNAEYYRIEQFDYIGSLNQQTVVDYESVFPGRVTRREDGAIDEVDVSSMNLYRRETEGLDLSADYAKDTAAGRFSLHAVQSIILHLKNQYSLSQPETDAVGFPAENGAGKYKANATLNWESGPLALGWTARYFGSYHQYGAAGGPNATERAATGTTPAAREPVTTYTLPQGGDTIPSQLYHDLFVGYSFGRAAGARNGLLDGLTLQLGVRNVFNEVPPLDAYERTNYYLSAYENLRLRSFWVNARMSF